MRYVKALWLHNFPDEPIEIYSEIDDARWETRKIELFRDGSGTFASSAGSTGTSGLAEVQYPSLEEINSDPQFRASEITKDQFEQVWAAASGF